MEAIALYDFEAVDEDELTFNRGDKLLITNIEEDVNWYTAELKNKCGYIPANYIEMKDRHWYYGRVTRVHSELILMNRKTGSFVVRISESSPSDFSLSLQFGSKVRHYKIFRDSQKKYHIWDVKFDSLNQLIDYYHNNSMSMSKDIKLTDFNLIYF